MSTMDFAQRRALLDHFFGLVPFNVALGIVTESLTESEAIMRLPYASHLVGNPDSGTLHGGAITAMMDASCGAAVFMSMDEVVSAATLDLRIDYLRLGEAGKDIVARARCYKRTRNVAFVSCTAYHPQAPDDLIASVASTFMLGTRSYGGGEPTDRRPPDLIVADSEQARAAVSKTPAESLGIVDRIRRFRGHGDAAGLVRAIPYARLLGMEFEADEEGQVLGRMPFAEHLVGNPNLPALHGGTLGSLLESIAIFQILSESETLLLPKTINLTVEYLRSARPRDTFARCQITKQGRRVISVRAEAWQDDPQKSVALAQAHFLIKPLDS